MQDEHMRFELFNGWAILDTPPPLNSRQGFFIETTTQESHITSWGTVRAQLRQRIGVMLYREYSKSFNFTPLFGGWASIWRPQTDAWVIMYTERGKTTNSLDIWKVFLGHILQRWQRERYELISKARKNPRDFDRQVLRFLDLLGFR